MATKKQKDYIYAVGRRKSGVARIRLFESKDPIVINGKPVAEYWPGVSLENLYLEPFRTTNTHTKYSVTAKIVGSGTQGQIGAFIHAVSRALVKVNPERFRPILKKRGFLTRDSRMKETRKPGSAGSKARAKRQSPKR
jgi:small subunit ribosomal protein S9